MKVSVIVSTYNRPEALLKVLQGLFQQTRNPDEIIIADDGSAPDTQSAIQRRQQTATIPLKHVWQEDAGFRAAEIRNKAILTSIGDYLLILDGDCIPTPYFVADHLQLAEPGTFFQGKRVLVRERLTQRFCVCDIQQPFRLLTWWLSGGLGNGHHLIRFPAFPPSRSTRLTGIRSCNMGFYRRDIFAVNGFNQAFIGWGREDSELAARFFKYGLKKKEHPFMAICFHLWHPEQNRQRLSNNDQLLTQALNQNEYYCHQGLIQS